MKKRLSFSETMAVGSMLFGLFFGAGNLIFPALMGQKAGANVWPAIVGFLITGVGIPLLGVASMGMSRSDGLMQMSSRVGRKYGMFFTCALYLTIGPFFAIPRCASTSFSVGIQPMLQHPEDGTWLIWIFSLLFFGAGLWFSLKPGKILTWVGKILTPLFLASIALLIVRALISPIDSISNVVPQPEYATGTTGAFFKGFIEGYGTMDALASLAFGIVVITAIRGLGVTEPAAIAGNTLRSGIFGCLIMALIYMMLAIIGAQSHGQYPVSVDGGAALNLIATHYFKGAGGIVLAVIATLACLKTAVGLVTSCGEMFSQIFPKGPAYRVWAIVFCVVSFLISTMGLSAITAWSLPVLMFLYPLAITLILLALFGKLFHHNRVIYISVTACTLVTALFDLVQSLPYGLPEKPVLRNIVEGGNLLPFSELGLSWVCPAAVGLVIGVVLHLVCRKKPEAA